MEGRLTVARTRTVAALLTVIALTGALTGCKDTEKVTSTNIAQAPSDAPAGTSADPGGTGHTSGSSASTQASTASPPSRPTETGPALIPAGTVFPTQPNDLPKGEKYWQLSGMTGQTGYAAIVTGEPTPDVVLQDVIAPVQAAWDAAKSLGYKHQDTYRNSSDHTVLDQVAFTAEAQQNKINGLFLGKMNYLILYPIYAARGDENASNYGWWWFVGTGNTGSEASQDYATALASAQAWAAANGSNWQVLTITP